MSSYTVELRTILESYLEKTDHVGLNDVSNVISLTRERLFDFPYPIFDDAYKPVIESKIMRHYYMREIGAETVGLFKLYLEQKMTEIMPYYNQLYQSELIKFNPMWTADYTKAHQGTADDTNNRNVTEGIDVTREAKTNVVVNAEDKGTRDWTETDTATISTHFDGTVKSDGTVNADTQTDNVGEKTETSENHVTSSATVNGTTNGTSNAQDRFSDTPQGSLANIDNNTYLTNATIKDGTTSETNKTTSSDSSDTTGGSQANTTDQGHTVSDTVSSNTDVTTNDTTVNETRNKSGNETTHATHDQTSNTTYNATDNTARTMGDNLIAHNTNEYLDHVKGNTGYSYSKLLNEYRDTFLNIDMQIIDELEELFMYVW